MPIYEYECDTCGKVSEKFYPIIPKVIPTHLDINCQACSGKTARKIVSTPNFKLKEGGVGWAEDGYSGQNPEKVVELDEPSAI